MGDLDETLCALGLGPRASLQCDLLPPRPKAKPAVVPEAPALPSVFALQVRRAHVRRLRSLLLARLLGCKAGCGNAHCFWSGDAAEGEG